MIIKKRGVEKGNIPWNKGLVGAQVAWNKGRLHPKKTKHKMSLAAKKRKGKRNAFYGKHHSEETKRKLSKLCGHKPWNKGGKWSPVTRKKLSISHMGKTREKSSNWKGGMSNLEKNERLAGRKKPKQCEICGAFGRICFDHNHDTGEFRGWICHRCNVVLGFVKDNTELLKALSNYLITTIRRNL